MANMNLNEYNLVKESEEGYKIYEKDGQYYMLDDGEFYEIDEMFLEEM